MLRANGRKSIAVQLNGLAEIIVNWLYSVGQKMAIVSTPIHLELENAHPT